LVDDPNALVKEVKAAKHHQLVQTWNQAAENMEAEDEADSEYR
jgi:hypothetical protein